MDISTPVISTGWSLCVRRTRRGQHWRLHALVEHIILSYFLVQADSSNKLLISRVSRNLDEIKSRGTDFL
jgi:hypothetical protein